MDYIYQKCKIVGRYDPLDHIYQKCKILFFFLPARRIFGATMKSKVATLVPWRHYYTHWPRLLSAEYWAELMGFGAGLQC